MAAFQMSFPHGQSWEDAKANFIKGINDANTKFGSHFKRLEWSDDKTAAKLSGTGFDVNLKVDVQAVHADGHMPWLAKVAIEKPLRHFLEETFKKGKDESK